MELEAIEKGGYDYFMLKEIFEQPQSIADAMRGRLSIDAHKLVLGGIQKHAEQLVEAKRIVIIACGTSWHAGLVAEYLLKIYVGFQLRWSMPLNLDIEILLLRKET